MDNLSLTGWPAAILLVLTLASYALRRFTPSTGPLHTPIALWLIATVNASITATIQGLQSHAFSWVTVEHFAIAGALSALAQANPSQVATAAKVLAFALFMPFACATPGGAALGACELGQLPNTAQSVIAAVVSIALTAGADWATQLKTLGGQVGPAQLNCAVAAVEAWLEGQVPKTGEPTKPYLEAIARLKTWQASHSATACAARVPL